MEEINFTYLIATISDLLLLRKLFPRLQLLHAKYPSLRKWPRGVAYFNQRLIEEKRRLKITNIHSILSAQYRLPSLYNSMLAFYLKKNGIELSWVRRKTNHQFHAVVECFALAEQQILQETWWWQSPLLTNKTSIHGRYVNSNVFIDDQTTT
ncbi:hypothetical protein ACLKMH_01810 [Psychromonas sp. KJ10-10]|uniref:hypothetical protein n=1 Tax=Psychromonas sp. KJ10-10 TaxID=3391823 RepID=UPI0039B413A0